MTYATDAHSLIWYFTEDRRLSKRVQDAFEETIEGGSIIIPTIVLAEIEIMFIAQKGRVTLTFRETLNKIESYENFEVSVLDIPILEVAETLEVDLEMHDKLIVATALYFNSPLITKDEQITNAKLVKTLW